MKQQKTKGKRGFASMSEEKRKAIAALGGTAAHAKGVAHEFTTKEAKAAGKKGGLAKAAARKKLLSAIILFLVAATSFAQKRTSRIDSSVKRIIIRQVDSSYLVIETKKGVVYNYFSCDTLPYYPYVWIKHENGMPRIEKDGKVHYTEFLFINRPKPTE